MAATAVCISDIATSFPRAPCPEITRSTAIQALDQIYERYTKVVVLEGPAGIGATTLLAQFARRHFPNCAALFIETQNADSQNWDSICLSIYEQVYWAVEGRMPNAQEVDEGEVRLHLHDYTNRFAAARNSFLLSAASKT